MANGGKRKHEESEAVVVSDNETAPARARPNIEHVASDIFYAIELFADGLLPREVSRKLRSDRQMSRATAHRYTGAALALLQRDDASEPVESKRTRYKAVLRRNIRNATDAARPDYKAVNQAVAMLMQLDGVLPGKAER